jgi:DNA-binding response OmpR family regulator
MDQTGIIKEPLIWRSHNMKTEHYTLLVVSDREFFRNLKFVLENASFGYCVLMATNNEEALRTFHEYKPNLILSATLLKDDQQLLEEVRLLPDEEEIPFIIVCSTFKKEILSDLERKGARIILSPFYPDELLDLIQICLKDSNQG